VRRAIAADAACADADALRRCAAAKLSRRRSLANRPARVGAQGVSMLADVYSNGFPNAHVARWEHPPNAGHTG
jgi:hypothetical protein